MAITVAVDAWAQFVQAFGANVVMSVDNAIVLALAVRALPERRLGLSITLAVLGIIALRLLLNLGVDLLASLPGLKLVGALVLLWIGVKLIAPDAAADSAPRSPRASGWAALWTVLLADLAMSVDNVLAVYGAAGGHWMAITAALIVSVPLVVLGSRVLLGFIRRFPVVIVLGGALIGFSAGAMLLSDRAVQPWFAQHVAQSACGALLGQPDALQPCIEQVHERSRLAAGALGALLVVALGTQRARRTGGAKATV